ncbi:hypothetical protein EHM92_08140 [bacterium]|nr:MAG: hypothetical protein EHM92_08140 [bacterium]
MTQEDIHRDEWVAFCESFGREHQDWLVNVEVLHQNGAKDIVGHSALLENIAVSPDGPDPGKILISISKTEEERRVHEVARPEAIRVEKNDRGAHESLLIESDNGDTTIICLHSPSLPDDFTELSTTQ